MNSILHQYRNQRLYRLFTTIFNFSGFLFPIIVVLNIYISSIIEQKPFAIQNFSFFIIFVLISWLFFGPVIIISGNIFYEIVSDANGLHVQFWWGKLDVTWDEVISVGPMYGLPWAKNRLIVKTKTQPSSFIHRIYGFFYSLSFHPCIFFGKEISECDELYRRVTSAIRNNQKARELNRSNS